jgi:hypothetical protein
VQNLGAPAPPLQLAADEPEDETQEKPIVPPVTDEYEWQWRVSTYFTVLLFMFDMDGFTAGSGDNPTDVLSVI